MSPARALLFLPAGVVLAGLVAAGVSAGTFMVFLSPEIVRATTPSLERSAEKLAAVERGRMWQLPTEPSISVDDATDGFVRITGMTWEFDGPAAETLGESLLLSSGRNPYGGVSPLNIEAVLPAAARGLTSAERSYLESFAGDRRVDLMSDLARAERFDEVRFAELQMGARFEFTDASLHWEMPIPKMAVLRQVAYNGISLAALRLDAGDVDGAQEVLQEAVSFGFLMVDEGSTLIAALVGGVIIEEGLNRLEQLAELTGRASPPGGPGGSGSMAAVVEERSVDVGTTSGWGFVLDSSAPRQLRVEALSAELIRSSCGSLSGMISGVPAHIQQQLEGRVRDELARTPREAALYDATLEWEARIRKSARRRNSLTELPDGPLEAGTALARSVADAVGLDRVAACWALVDLAM
jgi:hypothetical protein